MFAVCPAFTSIMASNKKETNYGETVREIKNAKNNLTFFLRRYTEVNTSNVKFNEFKNQYPMYNLDFLAL